MPSGIAGALRTHGRWQGLGMDRVVMHILVFLLFGLVVGAFARFIVPGREPGGWVISD